MVIPIQMRQLESSPWPQLLFVPCTNPKRPKCIDARKYFLINDLVPTVHNMNIYIYAIQTYIQTTCIFNIYIIIYIVAYALASYAWGENNIHHLKLKQNQQLQIVQSET